MPYYKWEPKHEECLSCHRAKKYDCNPKCFLKLNNRRSKELLQMVVDRLAQKGIIDHVSDEGLMEDIEHFLEVK